MFADGREAPSRLCRSAMRETSADSGREFLKCLILCSKLREVDSNAQFRGVVRAKSNGNAVFLGETDVMESI